MGDALLAKEKGRARKQRCATESCTQKIHACHEASHWRLVYYASHFINASVGSTDFGPADMCPGNKPGNASDQHDHQRENL